MNVALAPTPPHVDPNLIVDFDFFRPPGLAEVGIYEAWHKLHSGPDIIWTPHNGGHWVVTRGEDVKWVQERYEIFSHETFFIPREAMKVVMPPLTVDPPKHARYRSVINGMFQPARVRTLIEAARTISRETIDALASRGRCEFVADFARVLPVTVFLGLAGLPLSRREEFCEWTHAFVDTQDQAVKDHYLGKIKTYLEEVIAERTEKPGDDLVSHIITWRHNPRFESEAEILGMVMLMFMAGIDTVVNMLAFIAHHLATSAENRQRLIDDPGLIPQASEEFLRRFGLSNTGRIVKQPVDRKGAQFRPGDMVMVPIAMSSMDDRLYDRPLEVDFYRNAPSHNTFGNGPHKCVGAALARAELNVFLEEWLRRIPIFHLDPARPPVTTASMMNMMTKLHLVWETA